MSNNFGQYLAAVQAEKYGTSPRDYVEQQMAANGVFGKPVEIPDDEFDWQEYLPVPTPDEIHECYNRGFQGTVKPRVLNDAEIFGAMPTFYEKFPFAKDIGKGKLNLAYLSVLAFEPEYGIWEAQTRGSCVSHGTRNGGMCDYCADVLMGETVYKGRFCTENIYRMRGYNSCGANCGELAAAVGPEGEGGFLVRGKYGDVDLTTFSASTESWAAKGSQGLPAEIKEVSAANKAKSVFRCASPEEERDAHACGFGTNGCSGLGFASTTDEFGLAEQRGSWAHSMARTATDDRPWAHDKYGAQTNCTIQSWGKWNTQKGMPFGVKRQPGGCFWTRGKLFSRYQVYGYADVVGFGREGSTLEDYMVERAKKIQELVQQCQDDPDSFPQPA